MITGNGSPAGMGIYVQSGSPLIKNNTITNNIQNGGTGAGGGGIYLLGGSAQVINNTIANNRVSGGGNGGGIALNGSSALIAGNTVTGNYAWNASGGISVVNTSDALIANNVIANNTDGGAGFGSGNDDGIAVLVPSGSRGTYVLNNSLINNTLYIGGFFSSMLVENNISATTGSKFAIYCSTFDSPQLPLISNNAFFNPGSAPTGGLCASVVGTHSNIAADPLFVNPASDFHLAVNSPAIDSGNNSAPGLTVDIEGNSRIQDGNGDGSSIVDFGAYETSHPPVPAKAEFRPNSLIFPDQLINVGSTVQVLGLFNTGSVPAQLSQLATTGDFSATTDCPNTLPIASSCSVFVTFVPTMFGMRSGSVSFGGNFSSSIPNGTLSGKGLAAQADFSPNLFFFGDVYLGSTSDPRSTTLTNTGNYPLQIDGVLVSTEFHQTNDCPLNLAPGSSCIVTATFAPSHGGLIDANLTLSSNSVGTPVVSMRGNGLFPATVQLSTSVLDFGHLPPGATSNKTVTLTVNGSGSVNIGNISIAGPFSQTNGCGSVVLGGQSCSITVSYTPSTVGQSSGSLQVLTNLGYQFVSLYGFGSGAALDLSTSSLDFGSYWLGFATSPGAIFASNPGDQPLPLSIAFSGADFVPAGNNCPNPLPGGAQCGIQVQFRPTVFGPRAGTVTFTTNSSPRIVTLTGVGLDYSLSVSPTSVSVEAGKSASFSVSASDLGGNFGHQINLSCSTNAPASTCYLAQPFIGTGESVSFSVVTTTTQGKMKGTQPGTYQVVIQGASDTNHSASATLIVKK